MHVYVQELWEMSLVVPALPMMLIRTTRVTYKQSKKHSQITTNTSSSISRTGDKGRLAFWDVKNSISGL